MKFRRGGTYAFWLILDDDGYLSDYICTDDGSKPHGRAINLATLINSKWEMVGEEFKISGSLGGLPLASR